MGQGGWLFPQLKIRAWPHMGVHILCTSPPCAY